MRSDWITKKIGDVCEIHRGSSPRPIQNFLSDKGMPWVKIADATGSNSRYILKTSQYIIEEGISKSVLVTPGTLIVSNSATPGLPKILGITACVHDGWLILSNFKGVIRDFLFYKFIDIREHLVNQANGSVFQNLKTEIVKDFNISFPSIPEQHKIVSLLSMLDDKIELNNRINADLEQQAKTLFKSWFVDFEPFGGKMPKDWKKDKLGSFVEIKRGGSPRPIQDYLSDKGYRWLKISDVTSLNSPYILEIKEHIREEGLKKTVFLKKGSLVLSNSATPGIPKILDVDSCIHDGWLYFPDSLLSNEYLYLLFTFIRNDLVKLGNGSVFTNLKTDILRQFEIIMPSGLVLSEFQDIITSLFEMIKNNTRENQRLVTLRDVLLPKLMNGEIDVSDVEI